MLRQSFPKRIRRLSRFWGSLLAGTALTGLLLPQMTAAQGILPTFRSNQDRFVELRSSIQRGYRSANAARYHFYVRDPKITSQRFIITEVTDNFAQQGGQLDLKRLEVRICSDLGNALRRARCPEKAELAEVVYCSVNGCETYNPITKETTRDSEEYEGLPYLSIKPVTPLDPGQHFDIVLSDIKNPRAAVDYHFNLSIETPRNVCEEEWRTALGHCAIGTWIVPIQVSENN